MLHWFGPVFPFDIIYNIINFLTTILIISFFGRKYKVKFFLLILLIVTAAFPLLVNGPLMHWSALPDQSKYLKDAMLIRSFNFHDLDVRPSIYITSLILALTPLPFIETFNHLGFANRLLLSLLIIFLIKKKHQIYLSII